VQLGSDQAPRPVRIGQLDGLRAIAVLLVVVHHYFQHRFPILNVAGRARVVLFFVLSGYLISRILLKYRHRVVTPPMRRRFFVRFWFHRLLRVAPAFYLVLAIAAVAHVNDVTAYPAWHVAFASNLLLWKLNAWPASTAHLWSLGAEVQLYAIWPFLIFFTPARRLRTMLLLCLAAAPMVRGVTVLITGGEVAPFVLPFSIIDAFACGALLTLAGTGAARAMARPLTAGAITGVLALVLLEWWPEGSRMREFVAFAFGDTLLVLIAAAIVNGAVAGFTGWTGTVLQARVVRYLGTISYGIYLWHLFMPVLLYKVMARTGITIENYFALRLLWALTAVALSAAMWHLVEQPLSRLKTAVPYLPDRDRPRDSEMARVA
jgi:peptidoglycan/LPS O-acetylase OafA/YrhL